MGMIGHDLHAFCNNNITDQEIKLGICSKTQPSSLNFLAHGHSRWVCEKNQDCPAARDRVRVGADADTEL